MRVLLILLMVLSTFGCAAKRSKPPIPVPAASGEYSIPVIKADGTLDTFTVEPDGSGERMLFCIEGTDVVLCMAEQDGQTFRYLMPLLGPVGPDVGT